MIPTPHTITVRRWSAGAPDSHGIPADVWTDVQVAVHAVTSEVEESATAARMTDSNRLTVYAPAGTVVGPRDRIVWQGETFEADGGSVSWAEGPWANSAAGVVIRAKKVDG